MMQMEAGNTRTPEEDSIMEDNALARPNTLPHKTSGAYI